MQKLYEVEEISDLYADSFLTDEDHNLVFISLWGRDVIINEFIARITLSDAEQGIKSFHLFDKESGNRHFVDIRNLETLEKNTGRVNTPVFGDMVQAFLYEKMAVEPDLHNGNALMLYRDKEPDIWEIVKQVCHIPLLDHWKGRLLEIFRQKEWIKTLLGHGVNSVSIYFDQQQLEETLSELVKNGELTAIEGEPAPEPVIIDEEKNFSIVDVLKVSKSLQGFISKSQLKAIVENCRGEEKQFFYDKMIEMSGIIKKMPKTYDQEKNGDDAIAHLHYFKGSYDFYITEKDMEEIQYQAFGLAVMAEAELGYISIVELIENDFEIDLFFAPQRISELKKRHK